MSFMDLTNQQIYASQRFALGVGGFQWDAGSNPFTRDLGLWGDGRERLQSQAVDGDSTPDTAASVAQRRFRLTNAYAAATNFALVFHAGLDAAVEVSATIDIEVYKLDAEGNKTGSDLCTTSAITITDTFADASFTIDGSGLVAGDEISVVVKISLNDTGAVASGDKHGFIGSLDALGSSRGKVAFIEGL